MKTATLTYAVHGVMRSSMTQNCPPSMGRPPMTAFVRSWCRRVCRGGAIPSSAEAIQAFEVVVLDTPTDLRSLDARYGRWDV